MKGELYGNKSLGNIYIIHCLLTAHFLLKIATIIFQH